MKAILEVFFADGLKGCEHLRGKNSERIAINGDCDHAIVKDNAMWVSNIPFCSTCYDASNYVHDYVNNGTVESEDIDQILLEEHDSIVQAIAKQYEVSVGFIEWLLFESGIEDGKITSTSLQDQYLEYSIRYEELYDELLEGKEDDDDEVDDFSFVKKETLKLLEEGSSCSVGGKVASLS